MMKKTVAMTLAAGLLTASVVGGAASAAQLTFVGGGVSQAIKKNDLGLGLNDTMVNFITGDTKTGKNGLFLNRAARVTLTYLGFEAGNDNFVTVNGVEQFRKTTTTKGKTHTFTQLTAGLVPFAFGTSDPKKARGLFDNAGIANPNSSNYAIGYRKLSDTSYYALFDDIAAGDRDFDDIGVRIDVAAVPLPAAGLMLMGALGGIVALKRRRAAA